MRGSSNLPTAARGLAPQIGAAVGCLNPSLWGEYVFLTFAAYFDDAGSHGHSGRFFLAGHVATVEEWNGIEEPWRALLKKYGLE